MKKAAKLAAILRRPLLRKALLRNIVAGGVEHRRVLEQLDCRTIVDVGANRGQFALMARYVFPDAAIISFEPLEGPAARYRAVFAGDDQTVLHQAAIGAKSGEALIHISSRDDSSSLLPITATQNSIFPGTAEASTTTIRIGPLDEFIGVDELRAPALLKIDVQGFEIEALKGSEKLLPRFSSVYVECSFIELYQGQAFADEVISWLQTRGFRLTGVYNMSYDSGGRAIQADFLFTVQKAPV